jgi:hypothetical protein
MSTSSCPECGGDLETPSRGIVSYLVLLVSAILIVNGLGWTAGLALVLVAALVGWYVRSDVRRCTECGWETEEE